MAAVRFELESVEEVVGPSSYERGRRYVRTNRVLRLVHDPSTGVLAGRVLGNGALYDVLCELDDDGHGLQLIDGECTCPIGWNCKHVAALVIAAVERGALLDHEAPPPVPQWERPLRALLAEPAVGVPLAIELELEDRRPAARLSARLVRPGARGGWVRGSLSWEGLEYGARGLDGVRADHVALVKELAALRRAGSTYLFDARADRTLDLCTFESPRLWALLDAARRSGLNLLQSGVPIPPPVEGRLRLDVVSRPDGGWDVMPVLDVEAEPVRFIGTAGHGLVCVADGPPGQALRLVRLDRPTSGALQRLLLEGGRIEIPPSQRDRFTIDYAPALERTAPLISSDGSFVAPVLSGPELVLHATYGAGHAVDVGWAYRYRVGDQERRVPLTASPGDPGFRDLDAERALLSSMARTDSLRDFGVVDRHGQPVPTVRLTGMDTVRFTTGVLPELTELTVEIAGEATDFRDVGRTLELGVSNTQAGAHSDWFDLGVSITVEGREVPFTLVFAALAAGETHLLLEDGAHFSLLDERLQTLRALIDEARELGDRDGPLRISRYQVGLWQELAALGIVTEQAEAWRTQVEALTALSSLTPHPVPASLRAELRPYQRDGFAWLASLWELGLGGILADDMGLGKTLQALALICHARDGGSGPFLVVAPTSVVSNWAAEAARFAPHLRVLAVTDTMAKSGMDPTRLADADVVVTTYTLLRLDGGHYGSVAWAGLILDEAQHVKNHQAKTHRCVRELRAPFKLAITGTPMENNLMELWALLSIAAPGLFPDPKRFAERYARPIERAGDRGQLDRLRARIKPLVMRRTKEVVAADLPARQEQTLAIDLHPRHRKLYDTRLQRERQKVLGLLHDLNQHRFTILRSLTLMRQLSLHPALVDDAAGNVPCIKLESLTEHLGEIARNGHRALVFSQFTRFLGLVRDRLDAEGIDHCYLDGRTRQRARVIERFKTGADPVFLISLKAGGTGLNLTEADYCFLLDPWWNPATEQQAVDRIHRIGQTRPVNVYRVIARDTIEEKVVELARRKAELFGSVLDDGNLFSGSLTAEDVRGLLT